MGEQEKINEQVASVALRGEAWWHDPDNSLRLALDELPVSQSAKLWFGDVAVQSWTEGAITAVQEYGDEMRAADAEFDALWNTNMIAVNAWRAAHPGNDLVLPDMGDMFNWLLSEAGLREKADLNGEPTSTTGEGE